MSNFRPINRDTGFLLPPDGMNALAVGKPAHHGNRMAKLLESAFQAGKLQALECLARQAHHAGQRKIEILHGLTMNRSTSKSADILAFTLICVLVSGLRHQAGTLTKLTQKFDGHVSAQRTRSRHPSVVSAAAQAKDPTV
jgi:hypothetical protein